MIHARIDIHESFKDLLIDNERLSVHLGFRLNEDLGYSKSNIVPTLAAGQVVIMHILLQTTGNVVACTWKAHHVYFGLDIVYV